MANYREQPLSKGDYHNRVPNNNYHKTTKQLYNEDQNNIENYQQNPRKQHFCLETEDQDRNNRQYYQGNNKYDEPFSNNPYYNRAALDQVCSKSIITIQDQPNRLQDDHLRNELQRDNYNQINQQQEPISKYYNNDQRDRYQEVKNYYYNQNQQSKSILSPKLYSRDIYDQQQEQQKQTQNKQSINQQQKYQKINECVQENPQFGQIQDNQQRQYHYQSQPIQQQFSYQQQPSKEFSCQNAQQYVSNSTRQQVNSTDEHQSQRDVQQQQQRQCVSYQTQSPQRFHQDLPIQKQQQFQQRLQYLEELKSRIPKDEIFYQQVDKRMPQTQQQYRQEQNERINKINPIAAVSRMQRPNDIDQDTYHNSQGQYQQYQYQQREDYLIQSNRNNPNQYLNLYMSNKYDDQGSYQQRNNQHKRTRTPNRYSEDSYERERQQFIQQTSHIKTNSQTINKRK
ncbi:unnamed protein product (macronuclear) [Paramecium tetraurelia]|uniref:Uncharacterized protein n=1 Tax=Paramecium tetraurelia TaxID=5888 RepID=A0CW42_PARTE|nr:uncharacterized protein GSPATT00001211001 [Paramecium tetraurelia]CAK75009.1 unnamed protein product [Paramecium tetraurelia]|eukprot:XP_001442406.1 hypothetical protein (macronuclear) [Paramecium tetraurelia strain d4-2]